MSIKHTRRSNGFYNHNNGTIKWNPDLAAKMIDDQERVTGSQPASKLLFQEVGRAYLHQFKPDEYFNDLALDDSQYGNLEERKVIEKHETPATNILGHGTRANHDARLFNPENPSNNETKRKGSDNSTSQSSQYIGSAGPADKQPISNEEL